MNPFYPELERLMQSKLAQGWEEFRRSKFFAYCKEYHDFLWQQEEYNRIHRRRLPHGPYEYAARFVGMPLMNMLLQQGIYMNTWFPGYYDIEEEFANGRNPPKHPKGRVSQMVLLYNADFAVHELCKLSLSFELLHVDVHGDFGFKVPEVSIGETYCEEPEKFIRLSRAEEPGRNYHLLGESWVF
jgi:hypothetical protein